MTPDTGIQQFWDDFKQLDEDIEYFVSARLFDGVPAIWTRNVEYVRWRHEIAQRLDVDPIAIQLVGSARLGYSINPAKNFKIFNEDSDLDIAVVSPELFEAAWLQLRNIVDRHDELKERKTYLRKLVFDECIALDIVLPHLSFGASWAVARDEIIELLGEEFNDRQINYRLYRNHGALREYQLSSVSKARDRAIEEGVDN
ncbi:hypothetical protein [Gordonia sp. ABSL49_1]|uniref:hypothetical protein n=1 Tax=Gordonia sp. ABSL49_1 TaxID=2920941 RepID=UPI001F0D4CBC|nr:hypothetical protein [Gordonia sp. ABSL49_1]MCH5645625.1 hypothetical protein [Gordonia sp. ABSL49_1]